MALADILQQLLRQPGGPQNALAMAANAQGTAGPVGNDAYANALQAMRQQNAPQQPAQGASPMLAGSVAPQASGAPMAAPVANSGGLDGLFSSIANLINPQAAAKNQTADWLRRQGLDEGTATLVAGNRTMLNQYMASRMKGQRPSDFDQRAAAAKQYGLDISTPGGRDFVLTGKVPGAGGNQVSYGQTPLMLTDPQDKMHMGQMSNGGGILIDGKTYNSLPDGWKVGTVSQSGSGGLSPEALDILSTQYLAGDKSAIQGFSRNATMRAQLANAIAAKADTMGMDGRAVAAEVSAYGGNVAAQRAAGNRAAQVGMAASEASQMADIAVEASKAVPRGSLMAWNAIKNAVKTGTSSPEMAAFVTATTSLVNAYARAVSPLGAPTDAMRQHAEQMLNTAQSPQAYEAVINQMKKEMGAALNAPSEISNQLKEQVAGAHPGTSPPASSDLPPGVTEEDMQYTMKARNMTRQQVLDALKKAPAR